MRKIKNQRRFRKIFLSLGALSLVGSATLTTIACSSSVNNADQFTNFVIGQGDVVTQVLNQYYGDVLRQELPHGNSNVTITDITNENNPQITLSNYDLKLLNIFQWYVKWQTAQDPSYWPTQYGQWLSNGYITPDDFTYPGEPTNPRGNLFDPENIKFASGTPSELFADYQTVKTRIPVLFLELQKIAIPMIYFEANSSQVQTYFDKKNASNAIDKSYKGADNYWLVKYIQENKPNLGWQITYDSLNIPPSTESAALWNEQLRTNALINKKSPFFDDAIGGPSGTSLDSLLFSTGGLTDVNVDNIGGFMGIVNGSSQFALNNDASVNGFNYTNQDQQTPNIGKFGYVSNQGIKSSASGSSPTDNWSTAISLGSSWVRSIVYQLINVSTNVPASGNDQQYWTYRLSGLLEGNNTPENQIFREYVEFLIAVQNSSTTDTAREFYYNLGYKVDTYVKAIRDKLASIPNLLA